MQGRVSAISFLIRWWFGIVLMIHGRSYGSAPLTATRRFGSGREGRARRGRSERTTSQLGRIVCLLLYFATSDAEDLPFRDASRLLLVRAFGVLLPALSWRQGVGSVQVRHVPKYTTSSNACRFSLSQVPAVKCQSLVPLCFPVNMPIRRLQFQHPLLTQPLMISSPH